MSALSPSVVAAIDDLELAARLVVEGLGVGAHRSPFHGYSAEFQQHRPYRAGDDLKYLDWKLLARTDRLYSRQFRETTSMSLMLVVDASNSMGFPTDEKRSSKFRQGIIAAASLAHLVSTQGDAVGLMSAQNGKLVYLPARGGRPHLRSLIAKLDNLAPSGSWEPDRVIARGAELLNRRGLVVVISDFYDAEAETQRELRRVAHRGHDVAMLQVIAEEEREFPYRGEVEFEDLEDNRRRIIDASAVREGYRRDFMAFLSRCRAAALRDGIDYELLSSGDQISIVLRRWLLRRSAGHEAGVAAR